MIVRRHTMRLYLKRAFLCLFALMALTLVLIIQSIASYQTLVADDNVVFDTSQVNPKLSKVVAKNAPVWQNPIVALKNIRNSYKDEEKLAGAAVISHHEQSQVPVGDLAKFKKSKFVPEKRVKSKKLLSLYNLLPNNSKSLDNYCPNPRTLEQYWKSKYGNKMAKIDDWDKFYAQIGTCDLYRANSQVVENLLRAVAASPIKHIANLDSGTQVKFIVTFQNGKRALFKPMRFSRNFETHEDQFYFTDFERHNAEIAAFHLDRLLGFRRAVPTVGRVVNMTEEFLPNAEKTLARTFFYSPARNLCFVGKCDYYCDTTHAVCGKPDLVEGSFQAFLPDDEDVPRDHVRSPYKRTYSKRSQIALWQKDPGYCNWKVKYLPPYSNGRALLDLVDLYIFDFLMGNQDRHHYETITVFEEPINFLHLDNGRGFGKTMYDDLDILAPLSQCCVVRPSTLKTLLNFYAGPRTLGQSLADSLAKDPVDPVLADGHLRAVDRRLEIILRVVHKCIFETSHGQADKVLMDIFYNAEAPADAEEEEEDEE